LKVFFTYKHTDGNKTTMQLPWLLVYTWRPEGSIHILTDDTEQVY
jgi:hypothetical protein